MRFYATAAGNPNARPQHNTFWRAEKVSHRRRAGRQRAFELVRRNQYLQCHAGFIRALWVMFNQKDGPLLPNPIPLLRRSGSNTAAVILFVPAD